MLADERRQRQIESIISPLASHNIGRNPMPVRMNGDPHQLELRHICPLVLAVTVLHQPLPPWPMVAASRRAAKRRADPIAKTDRADFIKLDFVLEEHSFKTLPAFVFTQPREQAAEPIVVELLHQQAEKQRKIVQTVCGKLRRLIHAPKLNPNNSKCPTFIPRKLKL